MLGVVLTGVLLAACSKEPEDPPEALVGNIANVAAPAAAPAPTPAAAPAASTAPAGFDPASAPIVTPSLGGFPYFSLLDGYVPLNKDNEPSSFDGENQHDAAFDRYEFFDGTKVIPVDGRLRTIEAIGKGASFFQVQKTYEKLVHDLGGVTVWEGKGDVMTDRKLDFADKRHRGRYNMLPNDQMGVYMVRTPDREIWVEVYLPWDHKPDNYWVTVVEKKALPVTAKLLPAEALKKALDTAGHVALYVNFDTDKASLKPDAQPVLAEVGKLLTADPALKLGIEGHTDDAGTPAHNLALSAARANSVMGALMAQGIAADRLSAKGFGQTKPIADNASADGKAKNRRVELVKR